MVFKMQGMMAKEAWGLKRNCNGCGTRFYDMGKSPVICPKCSAPYELIASTRGRKARALGLEDPKFQGVDDLALVDDLDIPVDLEGEGDDALIDATDDLGGGLEDVSDVLDRTPEDDH